jgi:hypothetical protein
MGGAWKAIIPEIDPCLRDRPAIGLCCRSSATCRAQILPRAHTQRLRDRHRRTAGIGPASDCQDPTDLTRETVIRSAGLPRQKDPLPNAQGRVCRFRILPFVHNAREVASSAQTDENDAWNASHRTRPTQARKTPAIAKEPHQPGQTHHAFRASRRTATHLN